MKIVVGDQIPMNLLGSGSRAMAGYPSTITHTHNLALFLSILRYKNNDQDQILINLRAGTAAIVGATKSVKQKDR